MVIVTTAVYWGLNSQLRRLTQLTGPLNLPAPGRRQSVYINFNVFARTCVFSKQSLPSILCDPHQLQKQIPSPVQAPLLPKLRGHFAEFLNHSSPERLSILYLTTCVGLGYGPNMHIARGFSRQYRITEFTPLRATHHASNIMRYGFTNTSFHTLTPQSTKWLMLPHCVTPSLSYYQIRSHARHHHQPEGRHVILWVVSITDSPWARTLGYGNINPLSIDYACRPRLRPRLTLGRLT